MNVSINDVGDERVELTSGVSEFVSCQQECVGIF